MLSARQLALAAVLVLLPLRPSPAGALEPGSASPPAAEPSPATTATPAAEASLGVDTTAVPAAGSRRIRVLIASDAAERAAFESVLRELMQRLSVEVEVEATPRVERAAVLAPVPAGGQYLARCYVDLRRDGRALLYVHDPVRDRVLEREVPRAPGDEELAREELGHMLLASIEALLSGATLGTPRGELAAAAAPAAQPASTRTAVTPPAEPNTAERLEPARASWQLRGAILYELSALGHEPGIAHGPVLAGLLRAPFGEPGLGLLLSAQYRFPFDADADPIGMRVHAFALRALLTLEQPLGAKVRLRLGLGAGADVTRIAPERSSPAEIALADARTLTLGVTRGLLGVDLRLSPVLSLWAALAADVDLDRTQYVLVQRDGRDSQLIAPWRVRPALSLGVVLP